MDPTVRIVTKEELPACAELIRTAFCGVAQRFGITEQNAPGNGAFIRTEKLEELLEEGAVLFAVFLQNTPVGFGCVMLNHGQYELEKLAVLPDCRSRGYGDLLLCYACDIAREKGARFLHLGMIDENYQLKNWYLKRGFAVTGIKHFEPHPFTVCFMQKDLHR